MSRFSFNSITTTTSRAWHAYTSHKEKLAAVKASATTAPAKAQPAKQVQTIDTTSRIIPAFSPSPATVGERVKDFFVSTGSWILPFVIAGLLAVSSGYLFANFTDFSWNAPTFVNLAYVGGICFEHGSLMGVF